MENFLGAVRNINLKKENKQRKAKKIGSEK